MGYCAMSFMNCRPLGSGSWRMMPRREEIVYQQRVKPAVLLSPLVSFATVTSSAADPYSLPTYNAITISDAWKRPLNYKEMMGSQGIYLNSDRKWFFPKEIIPALQPTPGDQIEAFSTPGEQVQQNDVGGSTFWTILDVAEAGALTCWAMTCRDLVLVLGLADTIDIQRPIIIPDSAGVLTRDWQTVYTGLRCRVQLIDQGVTSGRGIEGFEKRYTIPVERQLRLTFEDRVLLTDGRYLDLKGYKNPEQIDKLPEIEAVERV
jgi:hypothetical protein